MSLKKTLAKAVVYLVLDVGALLGIPMRPDEIERLLNMNQKKLTHVIRNEEGDGKDRADPISRP